MEKKKLMLSIPVELDQKFREFIVLKYKTIEKGLISHEAEQALGHWIALHTNAQKTLFDKAPNPLPKVTKSFLGAKRYLLSKYYDVLEPGATVPVKYLREAIAQTRGSDERTIVKWLKEWTRMGLIKQLNASIWELVG